MKEQEVKVCTQCEQEGIWCQKLPLITALRVVHLDSLGWKILIGSFAHCPLYNKEK